MTHYFPTIYCLTLLLFLRSLRASFLSYATFYGLLITMTSSNHAADTAAAPPTTEKLELNGETTSRPLSEVCAEVAGKINRFLESEVPEGVLRDVQTQTRTALGVIEECLGRYRYVYFTVCGIEPANNGMECGWGFRMLMLNIIQSTLNLPLLQRRQRLPRPTHPPPRRPPQPQAHHSPTSKTPNSLHHLAAPLSRSNLLCRILLEILLPRPRRI